MKIAIVGTGYVGLVTGTCFADSGNDVTCIDINEEKIENLKQGIIPIFEPGLEELVKRNSASGRLKFTTDLASAVATADLVYLGVGTPQGDDGAANLSALWAVIDALAPHLREDAAVVIKSTVPVGTNAEASRRLKESTGRVCQVASNPEFLKEGAAIDDFMKPDRVVVGVRCDQVGEKLRELYEPFLRTEKPFLIMSPESAELTKYVANAMLATKISFINTMANLTQKMGGDINDVRRGIGHDSRIGFSFLFPGVGYGGSCFPKDVRALERMFEQAGIDPTLLKAVDQINELQKHELLVKIENHMGKDLTGKTIAIWGLAFKPRTDDIREAPALVMMEKLLAAGATLKVHDPEAMNNVAAEKMAIDNSDKIEYCEFPMDALEGADALAINTEWSEFRNPDFSKIKQLMNSPVIFDGRNLYKRSTMQELGFTYYSIGRQPVPEN